ncbi:MAG: hypothetical protein U9Q74_03770 [Gemmatimonadota bacterium]|nr:hypothetical protein [Gemmatimonadota bacterium]
MILEGCRLITDWLNDGTNGVNALLGTTPLDAGDSTPAVLVSILDATRDGNVARLRLPENLPGIAVVPLPVEGLQPHVVVQDCEGELQLALRIAMTKAQTEQGFRDTSYYLRTVVRSLRRFNAATTAPSSRQRNNIYLEACSELRMVQLWETIEDSVITGAVLATYHVRDMTPT